MENQKQRNIIHIFYGLFVVSSIASFVPIGSAQWFSFFTLTAVLIGAYIYKGKDKNNGLMHNHMTYLIRTIWIGTGFILLAVLVAAGIVFAYGDHSIINNAMDQISSGIVLSEDDLKPIMMDYMAANKTLLVMASIPTIGMAILYFVYRVANGYNRAMKGYRIANPNGWL